MHRYTQAIVERLMAQSKFTESWGESDAVRAAGFIYEEAKACGCGCGKRTLPVGRSLFQIASSFLRGVKISYTYSDFVKKHQYYSVPENYTPSESEHQIIISAILGDGCLIKPYPGANHRIAWNMGNKEHANHKLNLASFLGAKYRERENPGFGSEWFQVVTSCHPMLTRYAEKYGDSKGIRGSSGIESELNELGWAIYYGDDGHLSKSGNCFLHTEGKSDEMVEKIRYSLDLFTGIPGGASIHSYIGGTKKRLLKCIRMKNEASRKFMEKVAPHMANGMEYKIIGDYQHLIRR